MEFEIAKKLDKVPANVKGASLRSIKANHEAAQMIIVADSYGDIKTAVENFRMMTNADITFRMRGKSIDISVMGSDVITPEASDATAVHRCQDPDDAIGKLMEFAKELTFTSEDAMDVIDFWNKNMPLEGCEFVEFDMNQDRLRLVMKTDALDQDAIMNKLDEYNMGIVK